MTSDTLKYFEKYKRKLQVAILNNEDIEYLKEILLYVNAHGYKIHSLDDYIKDTNDKYVLHYQAGRPMPINKKSTIGVKLIREMELYGKNN